MSATRRTYPHAAVLEENDEEKCHDDNDADDDDHVEQRAAEALARGFRRVFAIRRVSGETGELTGPWCGVMER